MSIESEEFYNTCQAYRHAKDMAEEGSAAQRYQELIDYIDYMIDEAKLEGYSEGFSDGQESGSYDN